MSDCNHTRVICSGCGALIRSCRCFDAVRNPPVYSLCEKCQPTDPATKAKKLGVPLIPPLPNPPPDPLYPDPIVAVCGECGLELRQVMGYACTRERCPTRMRASP